VRLNPPIPLPDELNIVKFNSPNITSVSMPPERLKVAPLEKIVQLMAPPMTPPTEVLPPADREMGLQVQKLQSDTPAGADIPPLSVAVPLYVWFDSMLIDTVTVPVAVTLYVHV
jgi:hypothetical protein